MAFSRSSRPNFQKRLNGVEALEDRRLMAVIPVLNSLPGAAKSIFLDFDGDYQPVWTRDGWQKYKEISAQPSNLSEADIRKVWETVAEDYAPFNVNVTTVQPPSFANNVAVRVVIAGDMTAKLITGPRTTISVSGDRFIADISEDGDVNLVDTSGWASIESFTDSEPNVVYVFASYMQTSAWGTTSPEGHSRTLAALVANTASHEAGHSFGMYHHVGVDAFGNDSDYHVGTSLTTPIMGDNTAGDRTLWSTDPSSSVTYDAVLRLTTVLGARTDDHPSGTWTARPLTFTSSPFAPFASGSQAVVTGVISTLSDQDWFKFTTSGGSHSFNLNTVQFANLDAQLNIYKVVSYDLGPVVSLVASIDPATVTGNPFSGLGASYSAKLTAGTYMVAVKSHGSYGDLGNYTLQVNYNSNGVVYGGISGVATAAAPAAGFPTQFGSGSGKGGGAGLGSNVAGGGQGQGNTGVKSLSTVDTIFDAWNASTASKNFAAAPVVEAIELPTRALGIVDSLFSDAKLAFRSIRKPLAA